MPEMIELQPDLKLPAATACLTFSADASRAVAVGPHAWRAIQRTAANALLAVYGATGADAAVWLWERPWRTSKNRPSSLVTMFVGTAGALERRVMEQVIATMEGSGLGWVHDGVHPRPLDAFPTPAVSRGQLTVVWQRDREGPYALVLRRSGMAIKRHPIRMRDASSGMFLPRVQHAAVEQGGMLGGDGARKKRFELAFSLRVANRIVAADGVIDASEASFLRHSFPRELLVEHRLHEPVVADEVADMAEQQLGALLSHHEKLALLKVFYATCCADGRVDVREVRELRDAATALGLSHEDVVAYLAKLW
jgi:uncharacterized tellurite resistance protein B-like protein